MLEFLQIMPAMCEQYLSIVRNYPEKGCEYSFSNLFLWGRQRIAFYNNTVTAFSQFDRKSVYLFPVGQDVPGTLKLLLADAKMRGIPCRLTSLCKADCELLEQLYPGRFRIHTDRNSFDYIYSIKSLSTLAGRKLQKKRNHLNRFWADHPTAVIEKITNENTPQVQQMVDNWYHLRQQEDPNRDFHMEKAAVSKALIYRDALEMEGLVLRVDDKIVAMTMGSLLSEETFDVHFEKAYDRVDGAYAAINRAFARYIAEKFPAIQFLNREDDMGIEGLRQAKLSYQPERLEEKYWACLLEDGYDY